MQTAARTLYVVALALLIVMTIGFGQVTFYPGPDAPTDTMMASRIAPDGTKAAPTVDAETQRKQQEEYDRVWEQYRQAQRHHARNALAIATTLGVLVLIGGVVASASPEVLRVGMMLGGIFTVAWGLISTAENAGSGTMFAVALLAMIALALFGLPGPRRILQRTFRLSGADLLGPLH